MYPKGIKMLNFETENIEELINQIYGYVEVVKDSCEKNEYYSQCVTLERALEDLDKLSELVFSIFA